MPIYLCGHSISLNSMTLALTRAGNQLASWLYFMTMNLVADLDLLLLTWTC